MKCSTTIAVWGLLAFVVSCDYFEEEPYEISLFDEGAATLLDNSYTAVTQSLKLIVLEKIDSTWTDTFIDSVIFVDANERNRIVDSLSVYEQRLIPSSEKFNMSMSKDYSSGFVLLDLRKESSLEDYVFYLSSHLTMSIWDISANRIEMSDDAIPWGIVTISRKIKGRFSFTLENTEYIIRFTKSEKMIEEGESSFEMVFLSEEYTVPSLTENVCEILYDSKEAGVGIGLKTLEDIDSTWINSDVNDIMGVDSTRSIMVNYLDSEQASLSSAEASHNINVFRQLTVKEAFISVDLSRAQANAKWQFYLTEYLDMDIWNAVEGEMVEDEESGVTFTETGSCSKIRQKSVYTLDSQKYVIGFALMDPLAEFSKFHLVFVLSE